MCNLLVFPVEFLPKRALKLSATHTHARREDYFAPVMDAITTGEREGYVSCTASPRAPRSLHPAAPG